MTTKLRNGIEVLAKLYKGDLHPITYVNLTQAKNSVAKMGEGWQVYWTRGSVFYVTRD